MSTKLIELQRAYDETCIAASRLENALKHFKPTSVDELSVSEKLKLAKELLNDSRTSRKPTERPKQVDTGKGLWHV